MDVSRNKICAISWSIKNVYWWWVYISRQNLTFWSKFNSAKDIEISPAVCGGKIIKDFKDIPNSILHWPSNMVSWLSICSYIYGRSCFLSVSQSVSSTQNAMSGKIRAFINDALTGGIFKVIFTEILRKIT